MASIKGTFAETRQRWMAALSATNNIFYLGYLKFIYRPEPNSTEAFIDKISKATSDFFVVQIGANDGITHDPIHKFIKRDDWSGILVEPQKWLVKNKLTPLYKKHPRINVINAALGDENSNAHIYSIAFTKMRWATGLARFSRESLMQLFDIGMIKKKCDKYGIELPDDSSAWITKSDVSIVSPQSIIAENNVEKIDLLMIDTEGFDTDVVRMFLAIGLMPKSIIFERFHKSTENLDSIESMLESSGYSLKTAGPNTIATMDHLKHML